MMASKQCSAAWATFSLSDGFMLSWFAHALLPLIHASSISEGFFFLLALLKDIRMDAGQLLV